MKIKNYTSVRQNFDEFRLNVVNFKLVMLKIGADRIFIGAFRCLIVIKTSKHIFKTRKLLGVRSYNNQYFFLN